MRKIKTHLKFGILLLGVSLFFVNCEKETDVLLENDSLYKTASKDEIISSLNFNKSISAKGTAPYVTFNVDEAQLEDIKNTSAKLTVIPAKTKNENLYSRVLFLKVNDTVKGVVFNMHSNIKNKKGRFSGEITVNSLDGDLLKAFRVHNGHLNSVYNNNPSKKSSTNKSAQLFNKTEDDDGAECREVCGHPADDENCLCNMQWLDEVVVTAPSEIPVEGYYEIDIYYFFYSLYGDNSSYNINETQYIDPYDWVYQNNGGGGVETASIEQIINNLTGKADCVYQKMVDGNNNINWILENFEDDNEPSEFNLRFEMSTSLDGSTNASTIKSGNTFIIMINQNRAENINTTLTIARTILHEGIHARLREFASRQGSNETSFPGVYDFFRRFEKNWDHQQMAAFYRETIAQGLKQYDNAQNSDAFYDALAWEGLSEIKDLNGNQEKIYTEAWEELSPREQQRVLDIITEEKQNGNKTCEQ